MVVDDFPLQSLRRKLPLNLVLEHHPPASGDSTAKSDSSVKLGQELEEVVSGGG